MRNLRNCVWMVILLGLIYRQTPVTVLAQTPSAPTLTSATVDGLMVVLQWTGIPNIQARYQIEAGSAPGQSDLAVIETPSYYREYRAFPVPAGTYYVRLRTILGTAVSIPSNELVVTAPGCPPAPPTPSLTGHVGAGQSVSLQWSYHFPTGCAPDYALVEAGLSPAATDVGAFPISGWSGASFSNVPFGTYYVRVRLVRNGVAGPASNEVTLSIGCTSPPAFLNPTAEVVGNAARFSWQYGSNPVADYTVFIEAGSSPGMADLASIAVPRQANTGFNATGGAGTYYTRLRAVNACGSTVSSELPVTLTSECPLPGPIPFVDVSLGVGAPLYVTWAPSDPSGLAMSYRIDVGSGPNQGDLASRVVDGRWAPAIGYPVPFGFSESFGSINASKVYLRVTPINTCGAGPRSIEAHANATCRNQSPPTGLRAYVQGRQVGLSWGSISEYDPIQESIVEIGTSLYASNVLTSPVMSTYPAQPSYSVALPPGRYYARVRRMSSSCGEQSNPSPEVTFVIEP